MFRLFLCWLPHLIPQLRKTICIIAVAGCVALFCNVPPHWIITAGAIVCGGLFWRYGVQMIRFGRATWHFRTIAAEHIVLRHAPELNGRAELLRCLQVGAEALADFSSKFAFPLRRRLVIYLFPSHASVSRICNFGTAGFALVGGDAIVMSGDALTGEQFRETLLHELAHLYSGGWGNLDPPLKGEGLATWLMGSIDGKPIDFHALATLLTDRYQFLTRLTWPGYFYGNACSYSVAGSFTGHLIRRYGWERYRDFFQRANSNGFEWTFKQVYGLSLLTAERQWRDDLVERRHTFEPELTRFMRERSVEAAYVAGQVYRCLNEIEVLSNAGQVSGKVLWYAAATQMSLGHYAEAVSALEQAVNADDPWVSALRGASWLQLGNLYDLLERRDKAVPAYERTLAEPDYWYAPSNTTHAHARCYLSRPFTERDLQKHVQLSTKKTSGGRVARPGVFEGRGATPTHALRRLWAVPPAVARG